MDDYGLKPVAELRELAAARQIPGRSEMNKAELVLALQGGSTEDRVARLEERVESLQKQVDGMERLDPTLQ
jgi:Rho termination factor, N-terminal domain